MGNAIHYTLAGWGRPIDASSQYFTGIRRLEVLSEFFRRADRTWMMLRLRRDEVGADVTTDPDKLREADEEIAALEKAMNENRAATGAQLLFP